MSENLEKLAQDLRQMTKGPFFVRSYEQGPTYILSERLDSKSKHLPLAMLERDYALSAEEQQALWEANSKAIVRVLNVASNLIDVAKSVPTMIDRLDRAMGDTDPFDLDDPDLSAMRCATTALRDLENSLSAEYVGGENV